MKYFVILFALAAWGSLGLIIGKGVAGTWREESNADKKARILNDPDIQTCTHANEADTISSMRGDHHAAGTRGNPGTRL